jgi:membrane-associated phospholipid phosphatase
MKWSMKLLSIIVLLTLYHYYIHNNIEKRFCQKHFDYDLVKRPLFKCARDKSIRTSCIGMPSGHTESIAVFTGLLYFHKIISLWVCIAAIILMGMQRIYLHMHTPGQVVVGGLLGLLYAFIYKKYTYGFVFVLMLALALYVV